MGKSWLAKKGGWTKVDVGDDLLNSDEFGFVELEQLDASELGKILVVGEGDASGSGATDASPPSPAPESGGVVELKEQLQALKRQQKELAAKLKEAKRGKKAEESDQKPKAKKESAKKEPAKKAKAAPAPSTKKAGKAGTIEPASAPVDVSAWSDFGLDAALLGTLASSGFATPTPIQTACLPAAIRDRRDIIGAAQTGSGKTLAFGLPILHVLAQTRRAAGEAVERLRGDEEAEAAMIPVDATAPSTPTSAPRRLRALVLAPTRELALQVCAHLESFARRAGVWVAPVVGGMSVQKQERLLRRGPEIVVATPGRLWERMREGTPHLTDLSALSFLVIDEADRMVQQGHYAELGEILARVQASFQAQRAGESNARKQAAEKGGAVVNEETEGEREENAEDDGSAEATAATAEPSPPKKTSKKVFLQTFVFSATLTLPSSMRHRLKKGGGGSSGSATLDSLMDRVPFFGRTKPAVVDLTPSARLASSITEAHLSCPEAERDEYLYALLVTHPGRTIIFVNAVSSVRRLAALLRLLGLQAAPLHAGMQQRQRLRALDRFRADSAGVLVATDVAARGLDIPDVACVVHYQLPASLDTYVHRSGRTARASAEGLALALVTPREQGRFLALYRALGRPPPDEFPVDLALLPGARKRVRLAVRLDELERRRVKAGKDDAWRERQAEELGIELSDGEDDEDGRQDDEAVVINRRGPSDEQRIHELRQELAGLLAEPLQPGFSTRYFTAGAAAAIAAKGDAEAGLGGVVREAVHMAQALSDSRKKAAATAQASAERARQAAPGDARKGKKRRPEMSQREAALEAAVARAMRGKKARPGGGRFVVVSGPAIGRQIAGPSALEALRATTRNGK